MKRTSKPRIDAWEQIPDPEFLAEASPVIQRMMRGHPQWTFRDLHRALRRRLARLDHLLWQARCRQSRRKQ